jgi:hypothetical protein
VPHRRTGPGGRHDVRGLIRHPGAAPLVGFFAGDRELTAELVAAQPGPAVAARVPGLLPILTPGARPGTGAWPGRNGPTRTRRAIDITARIERRQVLSGLISEYRRAA